MTRTIVVAGKTLDLQVRRNALARRMSLRLVPGAQTAVVVVPRGARIADALTFARSRSDWLAGLLAAEPARTPFQVGALIPLLGTDYRLVAAPADQRGIIVSDREIRVSGFPEHFSRRVGDWLIERARTEIELRARTLAAKTQKAVARVRIGDPKSRWGSASAKGTLSFSWRLILAPPEVLHYVVVHEIAHLSEMNHGPHFWRIVESLTDDRKSAQAWLKHHGQRLHLYG